MNTDNPIKSVLDLKGILVNNIAFNRTQSPINSDKLKLKIGHKIGELDENSNFKVSVNVSIDDEDNESFNLTITVTGHFGFNSEGPIPQDLKNTIINKNTLAILFPYIRSQVTLITSQPGMTPIVIPPININAVIEESNES